MRGGDDDGESACVVVDVICRVDPRRMGAQGYSCSKTVVAAMTKSRIKKSRKRMRSRAASMLLHYALTRQEGGGMRLVRMWAEATPQRCERRRLMQLYSVAMLKIAASRRMFGMSPLQQAHYIASS